MRAASGVVLEGELTFMSGTLCEVGCHAKLTMAEPFNVNLSYLVTLVGPCIRGWGSARPSIAPSVALTMDSVITSQISGASVSLQTHDRASSSPFHGLTYRFVVLLQKLLGLKGIWSGREPRLWLSINWCPLLTVML